MKIRVRTLSLVICIFAAPATNAVDKSLMEILQGRYSDLETAIAARDGKAIAGMMAPGFTSEDVEGKTQSVDSLIRDTKRLPRDPKRVSFTTIESVSLSGTSATVTQRFSMRTSKSRPDGTPQIVELVTVSTDTWLNVKGPWLLLRTVTTQLDYAVDGLVVVHKSHAAANAETPVR